jgi:hypothetical protein
MKKCFERERSTKGTEKWEHLMMKAKKFLNDPIWRANTHPTMSTHIYIHSFRYYMCTTFHFMSVKIRKRERSINMKVKKKICDTHTSTIDLMNEKVKTRKNFKVIDMRNTMWLNQIISVITNFLCVLLLFVIK